MDDGQWVWARTVLADDSYRRASVAHTPRAPLPPSICVTVLFTVLCNNSQYIKSYTSLGNAWLDKKCTSP